MMNSKAHIIPFAVWLGAMLLLQALDDAWGIPRLWYPAGYAAKSVICALLFFMLKPWKGYGPLTVRGAVHGVWVGVMVCVLWILPESGLVHRHFPALHDFYYRYLVAPIGALPSYYDAAWFPEPPPGHLSLAYSPVEAGWILTWLKLAGSGLVIAALEEFFFRGYLYRRFQDCDFGDVPMKRFSATAFALTVAIFAVEHDRWLAGAVAGVMYGALALRTGNIWSCVVAHSVTNILLGLYTIGMRAYGFW
jgi:membrane protease YdiL (CAAX protease family)